MQVDNSFFSYFNPFSNEFKQAAEDFGHLSTLKKITVVALSILSGLATFFILGLGSCAVFRLLVNAFTPQQNRVSSISDSDYPDLPPSQEEIIVSEESFSYEEDSVYLSPESSSEESIDECDTVIEDNDCPENAGVKLAKRWGLKILPVVLPEAKLPLQVLKIGDTLSEASAAYQNGDSLKAAKLIAPLALGGAAMAYGGPAVAMGLAAFKAYSFANLVIDTLNYARDDEQSESSEEENLQTG